LACDVDVSACPQAETDKGSAALKTFGLRTSRKIEFHLPNGEMVRVREQLYRDFVIPIPRASGKQFPDATKVPPHLNPLPQGERK